MPSVGQRTEIVAPGVGQIGPFPGVQPVTETHQVGGHVASGPVDLHDAAVGEYPFVGQRDADDRVHGIDHERDRPEDRVAHVVVGHYLDRVHAFGETGKDVLSAHAQRRPCPAVDRITVPVDPGGDVGGAPGHVHVGMVQYRPVRRSGDVQRRSYRVHSEGYARLSHVARPVEHLYGDRVQAVRQPGEGTGDRHRLKGPRSGVQAILVSAYAGRRITGRPVDRDGGGVGEGRVDRGGDPEDGNGRVHGIADAASGGVVRPVIHQHVDGVVPVRQIEGVTGVGGHRGPRSAVDPILVRLHANTDVVAVPVHRDRGAGRTVTGGGRGYGDGRIRGVHDEVDGDDDSFPARSVAFTSARCSPSDNPVTFRKLDCCGEDHSMPSTRTWYDAMEEIASFPDQVRLTQLTLRKCPSTGWRIDSAGACVSMVK